VGLGMGFWVSEGSIWQRVMAFRALDEIFGGLGVNLALGQSVCGWKRSFKVGEELIWLRFKVCWAWDGVWGR
jgi:hypothetical protein